MDQLEIKNAPTQKKSRLRISIFGLLVLISVISLVLSNYWHVVELGKAQKTITGLHSELSDVKAEYELLHAEPDKMKALHLGTGGYGFNNYHWIFYTPPVDGKRYRVRAYVGKLAGKRELVDAQEVEHGVCSLQIFPSRHPHYQSSFWISFLERSEDEILLVLAHDRGTSNNRSSLKRNEFPFMFMKRDTLSLRTGKFPATEGGRMIPSPWESKADGGKILLFQTAVETGVEVAPNAPNAMQIWLESVDRK